MAFHLKIKPIGICDNCGQAIKINWYTSKRTPRLYCCRLCRNTSNSRIGAGIRSEKAKARVQAGVWQNPGEEFTPAQRKEYARLGGAASQAKFIEEVKAGQWRNPALSTKARAKLSRPRTIQDKALHSAISKLLRDLKMADLTPQEADKYRAYRPKQARRLRASWTPEDRELHRAKWREYYYQRNIV